MNIVGIIGKAGSGKDTVADMLHELRYDKIAFADPLKRFCMDVFEFTEEQLWGPSEKRSEPDERYLMWTADMRQMLSKEGFKEHPDGMVPQYLTPRFALQQIGTEGVRACYSDIWVEYAIRKSKQLLTDPFVTYDKTKGLVRSNVGSPPPDGVIISDCRFENEIRGIRKAGGRVIKIVRDGAGLKGQAAQHASETEQDSIPESLIDHVIYNNSTLDDLKKKVTDLLMVP